MASARTTFWNRPSVIRNNPQLNISRVAFCGFSHCGMKSVARTMGPATSCGKNVTYSAKSRNDREGADRLRYTSSVYDMVWKV